MAKTLQDDPSSCHGLARGATAKLPRRLREDRMKPAQFSLRQLLVVSWACAILFAIAAPMVRPLSVELLVWFSLAILAGIVTFTLTSVWLALRRQKTEQSTGRILLQVMSWSRFNGVMPPTVLVFSVLMIAVAQLSASGAATAIYPAATAVLCGLVLAGICWLARSHQLEICENGLIVNGLVYYEWARVKRYAWSRRHYPRRLEIRFNRTPIRLFTIRESQWRAVDALLVAQVRRGKHPETAAAVIESQPGSFSRRKPTDTR